MTKTTVYLFFFGSLETTLDSTLADDYIDLHSFEEIEDIISQRTFKRILHVDFIYKRTNLYKREKEIRASIEALIDKILDDKCRKNAQKDEHELTDQSNSHIFIDQLMHLTQDGRNLSPLEIRQNVIAIIFAVSTYFTIVLLYTLLHYLIKFVDFFIYHNLHLCNILFFFSFFNLD